MADPLTTQIISVTQSASLDSQGNVVPQVIVSYKIGGHGPFTAAFPAASFSAAAAQQVINQRAAEINQLVSMS